MTLAQFERLPESERAWWVAEHEITEGACLQCGGDRAVCGDPDVAWYPQRSVCYQKMANESANARYDERYGDKFHDGTFENWAPKRSAMFPFGHREGVNVWVAADNLDPDGDWL